jgi:hypothetical protein
MPNLNRYDSINVIFGGGVDKPHNIMAILVAAILNAGVLDNAALTQAGISNLQQSRIAAMVRNGSSDTDIQKYLDDCEKGAITRAGGERTLATKEATEATKNTFECLVSGIRKSGDLVVLTFTRWENADIEEGVINYSLIEKAQAGILAILRNRLEKSSLAETDANYKAFQAMYVSMSFENAKAGETSYTGTDGKAYTHNKTRSYIRTIHNAVNLDGSNWKARGVEQKVVRERAMADEAMLSTAATENKVAIVRANGQAEIVMAKLQSYATLYNVKPASGTDSVTISQVATAMGIDDLVLLERLGL